MISRFRINFFLIRTFAILRPRVIQGVVMPELVSQEVNNKINEKQPLHLSFQLAFPRKPSNENDN